MKKTGWLTRSALLFCLAVAGCAGDSQGDTDGAELATKGGELERPDGAAGKPAPGPGKDAPLPGKDVPPAKGDPGECGPIYPEDAAAPTSPCAALLCPPNSRCEVQEVQCVRAPCPPIATCVPVSPEPARDGGSTAPGCAATSCPTGTNCVETSRGAQCVPIVTCASTLCMAGTTCVETPHGPECVAASSCKGHPCAPGMHCELEAVQCIRAPCPAQPVCVADLDGCATVRCRAGTHCELKEVQCVAAPCNPVPECVAD